MKSYWFLFWAYTVIWGFLAGFLLLLLDASEPGGTEDAEHRARHRGSGEGRRD